MTFQRLGTVTVGLLLIVVLLAFVSDVMTDQEPVSSAPTPPSVWVAVAPAGTPP